MLLTNGDSFTYGDELPGSRPKEGKEPSHFPFTYTQHLANQLGHRYINLAQNGSSNIKIYRRTLDFLQKTSRKVDYMVIMWSSWGRLEVCEPFSLPEDESLYIGRETDMNQLIPSHKSTSFLYRPAQWVKSHPERSERVRDWFMDVYTMHTSIVHSLTYMKNIQFISDLMGIKVLQCVIHEAMYKNILFTMEEAEKEDNYQEYRDFISESFKYLRPECAIGLGNGRAFNEFCNDEGYRILDGGHPDHEGHEAYAKYLLEIMKSTYSI